MSRWYRAYEGTCTDPKLAEAAFVAGCSRSVAIAAWHLILENTAAINDGGRFDIPTRRIAAALCEPLDVLEALIEGFASIGLIADSHVAAWKRRQYESDTSAERVRKHRKRKKEAECNGDETLQPVSVTPPKTETETETDIPLPDGNGASAIDFTKGVFDTGKAILMAAGHDERQAGSLLGRLRNDANKNDALVMTVIAECQAKSISDPFPWMRAAIAQRLNNAKPASNDEIQNPYARIAARRQAERASAGHR